MRTTFGLVIAGVLVFGAGILIYNRSIVPLEKTSNSANVSGSVLPTPESSSPSSEQGAPSIVPKSQAASVKEFTITGKNFSFDPSSITVKKGDTVKITFKNASGMHDFRIDEFRVATKIITGGKEETVEFTADKSGMFEYYCSVGKHRQMGMKGMLMVE